MSSLMIKKQQKIQQLSFKPCAIIIGPTGVGKSTLINRLCDCAHESGEGDGSVTRNLFRNSVSHGNYCFELIDTPGTDSDTEVMKHAILIKEGLTACMLNTIFVVCRFETRYPKIFDQFSDILAMIETYKKKVVVMVSYWDICQNKQKAFDGINQLFDGHCDNVIYCSSANKPSDIAQLMYSCISNMQSEKLTIDEHVFLLKFNILEGSRADIAKFLKQFDMESKKLYNKYSEIIPEVMRDAERDDILYTMNISFRNDVQNIIDKINQQALDTVHEMHYFTLHIQLQKKHIEMCDAMANLVKECMTYDINDNTDPRNMIKKCPYCPEIWFKIEGCDGTTTCGNLPSKAHDSAGKAFYSTTIGGKLKWNKSPPANPVANPKTIEKKTANKGCGRSIVWRDCPKVDESVILDLFKVQTIEQAKQLIQNDTFKGYRNNMENSIDKTFYS